MNEYDPSDRALSAGMLQTGFDLLESQMQTAADYH
jgi:hypothetical protein